MPKNCSPNKPVTVYRALRLQRPFCCDLQRPVAIKRDKTVAIKTQQNGRYKPNALYIRPSETRENAGVDAFFLSADYVVDFRQGAVYFFPEQRAPEIERKVRR